MRTPITFILLVSVSNLCPSQTTPDKSKRATSESLLKSAGLPRYAVLNINNIRTWSRSDGQSNHAYSGDNGAYYPTGTGNVIYQDCIVWGAKAFIDAAHTQPVPTQPIRVGGGTYTVGTKEGWVNGFGATATAEPTTSYYNRIYRIRRDFLAPKYRSLEHDAADVNEGFVADVTNAMVAVLVEQYRNDWLEWPVLRGAPYIERNGIPGYQPPPLSALSVDPDSLISGNYDEPGLVGSDAGLPADQVIWTVYNDLDVTQSLSFVASFPLGLEIQKTVWGYFGIYGIQDMYFTRYRFINKGGVDVGGGQKGAFYLDSMYIAQFSDIDIGNFTDDLVGCDTTLSLGFGYNANRVDDTFRSYNLSPPAIGYVLLQGPMVASASDSAVFDMRRRFGTKNLRATSMVSFSSGSSVGPPPDTPNWLTTTGRWWKMLRGFAPLGDFTTRDTLIFSGPFPPSKFVYSGDPLARTGWLDGLGTTYSFAPGDRRIVLSTGPFTLAPGDTQEVIIAGVAGIGGDNISSVGVMKYHSLFAHRAMKGLFDVPHAPTKPSVTTVELDRQIILEWGSDIPRVKVIEERIISGEFVFEGYNVYQLPSATEALTEGVKLATFDRVNGVTRIIDYLIDPSTGLPVSSLAQQGFDSGVQRHLSIRFDKIADPSSYSNIPLRNGQEYYFAVTAYNYSGSADALVHSLESSPVVVKARPRIPFGSSPVNKYGDTLKVTRISGQSDGNVVPLVVNPSAGTGDTYEVRFDTAGGKTTWRLNNTTRNRLILSSQTNQENNNSHYTVEGGILLKVIGPLPGMKQWSIPIGTRVFSPVNGFTGLGLEGFGDAGNQTLYDQTKGTIGMVGHFAFDGIGTNLFAADYRTTLLRSAPVPDTAAWNPTVTPTNANFSRAYRWLNAAGPPAEPSFAPWIVNVAPGYPYQTFDYGVPFSAWDVETSPPTRLAVGHVERNVVGGKVDGRYWPYHASETTTNSTAREFAFILKAPYSTTPVAAYQANISNNSSLPLMWVMTCSRRNSNLWAGNDEFLITAAHVNNSPDVFSYTIPAPQTGPQVQKQSAQRVGVFPNPYYGSRDQETTTWRRFVTFNNLPPRAKIYIFSLAGHLVRTLDKDDTSQFLEWDLTNKNNWQVASGIYICYVEMPDIGETKILKVAVIQSELPVR